MKYVYLKTCILLLLVTFTSTATQAQGRLYVHNINRKQQSYPLSGVRKLTFPTESMLVSFRTVPSKSYSFTDIQYLDFKDKTVGENDFFINLYPNPTADEINIECSEEMSEITLYDIIGRKIMQSFPKNALTILQLVNCANGIYMLVIITDRGTISKRIIKT